MSVTRTTFTRDFTRFKCKPCHDSRCFSALWRGRKRKESRRYRWAYIRKECNKIESEMGAVKKCLINPTDEQFFLLPAAMKRNPSCNQKLKFQLIPVSPTPEPCEIVGARTEFNLIFAFAPEICAVESFRLKIATCIQINLSKWKKIRQQSEITSLHNW